MGFSAVLAVEPAIPPTTLLSSLVLKMDSPWNTCHFLGRFHDDGVAGTVATSFDGYPMARKGLAGKALAIAAFSSFFGGTVGVVLLFGFAPALATVALLFHSAEYFALMVVGLSAIAAFAVRLAHTGATVPS